MVTPMEMAATTTEQHQQVYWLEFQAQPSLLCTFLGSQPWELILI